MIYMTACAVILAAGLGAALMDRSRKAERISELRWELADARDELDEAIRVGKVYVAHVCDNCNPAKAFRDEWRICDHCGGNRKEYQTIGGGKACMRCDGTGRICWTVKNEVQS